MTATEDSNERKNPGKTHCEETSDPPWILDLDDSIFARSIMSSEKIAVEFWKEFCAPCAIMKPIYNRLSRSYIDRVTIGKARIDHSQAVVRMFGIFNVPTVLFFHNGRVVDTLIGIVSEKTLEDSFERIYSM